jgi:hypothetical protein
MFDFDLAKIAFPKDGGEFTDKARIELVLGSTHDFSAPSLAG